MNILSINYDAGSRIPGARFAPSRYYQESIIYSTEDFQNISLKLETSNLLSVDTTKLSQTIEENNIKLAIGGDHSITYLLAEATIQEGACLVIFDAHLDYFKNYDSSLKNWNFLSYLAEIFDKIIVIGERNFEFPHSNNGKINCVTVMEYWEDKSEVLHQIDKFTTEARSIYLSIDLDVLDPSVFDSVSYPLIGGIQMIDLIGMVSKIINSNKVYFCDVVEYNPMLGGNNDHIFYEFIQFLKRKFNEVEDEL